MKKSYIIIVFISFAQLACTRHKTAVSEKIKTTNVMLVRRDTDSVVEEDKFIEESAKFDAFVKKHRKALPGVKGYVGIGFTNEADGSLTHISVIKSLGKSADAEALRLAGLYPHWQPSRDNGKPQSSKITTAVVFGKWHPENKH